MDMGFSCRKNAFFQAPIKLTQPFPAPELRAKMFTDTRNFSDQVTFADTAEGLRNQRFRKGVGGRGWRLTG